ncbi:MAG: DegT/DnrJ/EryC1/StrS family aminotransferase [Chitinophagaceae bacterium]|nr:DegT/DnrJ/EryC1/StrS family aminotransferase [Chitinophagaceae bacterium]MCA6459664.1 DegT/DnrJ/EryC1/StrS family aminotransferase [Chitinophagaceae bacterium]MCA6464531.1 DegT/DnrJ/EryC1/StrS family aminotransferase [Chitinophagaceae bacterium]
MIPISKPFLTKEEAQLAYDTILTGWITQGPRVTEFEEKFATYVGAKYAVAVSNCTTALHLAMIVAGVGSGDEVICPSLSYIATANAIKYVNAIPVFAEIDPVTYNLDALDVERKITKKTKAILLVHQIGMPADIDRFAELAKKYDLKLIEDAACAAGSSYKGKKIGSHSDLVCFSLHPRKVITTGDGGFVTTNREDYYKRIKLLRQHGMSVNDRVRHESNKVIFEDHIEVGYNYRLTDIQASVGIKQLEKLDWIVNERRKIAEKYNDSFKSIPYLRLPLEEKGYFSNYQSYSVYLKDGCPVSRNELMQQMLDLGIATRRGIMTIHRESAYKNECENTSLPVSEDASDNSILLPLYVPMSDTDIDYVIRTFMKLITT